MKWRVLWQMPLRQNLKRVLLLTSAVLFNQCSAAGARRLTAGTSVASLIDVDYGSTLKWNNL